MAGGPEIERLVLLLAKLPGLGPRSARRAALFLLKRRALVMEPSVLLADEPTGNLDRMTARGVVDLLLEINRARKLSLLMVTHNEQVASRLDRLVRIDDGRIAG